MAFVIALDENPGEALARLIAEQGDKLETEGEGGETDAGAYVHRARVRCKRIRATLALAAPLMADKALRKANHWWRDAARMLGEVRDASTQTEALETLQPMLAERVDAASVRALSSRLRLQHRLSGVHRREAAAIRAFRARIAGRDPDPLADAGNAGPDLLADGALASYRAARLAMRAAIEAGTPQAFHEWRKRTKAHGLQLKLVRLAFPLVAERAAAVRDLASCLGAIQDIEVLRVAMRGEVGDGIDARISGALLRHRDEMRESAKEQGEALFGEKPRAWRARALDRELATTDV